MRCCAEDELYSLVACGLVQVLHALSSPCDAEC